MAVSKYARQEKRLWRTNDQRWLRLRALVLREEPFCRYCLRDGVIPPRTSVICDHIDGNAETLHDYRRENLQGLCRECDGLKSILQDGGFGGTRKEITRRGCDENGVPLDASHHWNRR